MLGLYVHIPFCSAICNYCNFNRGLFDGPQKARYVDALLAEIAAAGRPGTPADTIYFGGGTPSLLEPAEVARIVGACRQAFDVAADAEVTLEANPESVDEARLAELRTAGVNRLSFGVQSFESVDAAMALAPDHVSFYLLEVYPNAPLKEDMARARWSQAPDDDAAAMYVSAMERLESGGYEQYEISNVARPGFRSRHNLKYWTDGEWLGFGCGAHTTRGGVRTKNVSSTDDYIACVVSGRSPAVEVRRMSPEERLGDALFTGLRLTDGINLDDIRDRYGVDVWERYGAELAVHVEAGLLRRDGPRLWLTRQGMLLAHEVMTVFV